MSTYKVIQDIESEDKLVGPFTFRQCIYLVVTIFFLFLSFIAIKKSAPFLLIIFLPPALFTGFLAFPFQGEQPTEVWAVAKIGFLFKPRKRIWDQSGVKELVTITVPKKINRVYTNGLSQKEVASRLSALANTIDSRGWAIKNVNVNLFAQPTLLSDDNSDRLVAMSSMPQQVVDYDVKASDDILDEQSNPIAQQFTQMISASAQAHRQQLIDQMNAPVESPITQTSSTANTVTGAEMWFARPTNLPQVSATYNNPINPTALTTGALAPSIPVAAAPTAAELAFLQRLKLEESTDDVYAAHMKTIQPLAKQPPAGPSPVSPAADEKIPAMPASPSQNDSLLKILATNNDRDVASLAREAHKATLTGSNDADEVVVSLR